MNQIIPFPLQTKKEVARKLRKCERSIDNLMAAKAIDFVKVGRSVRFTPEAVERFIKSHTVNAA